MAQNTNFKGNKNNNQKKKLPYIKEIYSTARLWKRIIRHLMNSRAKMNPRICRKMNRKALRRVCNSK